MPANKYFLKSGEKVVGTTTVCNQLGKGDNLMNWSHKIAYESTVEVIFENHKKTGKLEIPKYEDIQKWQGVRDSAGDIGTQVHKLVLDFLSGEELVIPDNDIIANCFEKFLTWWKKETQNCKVELLTELPLVSERYRYGGQLDIYNVTKGKLIDIKTSGGIYDSYWIQLAGYEILLREHGYKPKEYQIVWLPKDDRFDAPIRKNLSKEKKIFKALLNIYYWRKNEH